MDLSVIRFTIYAIAISVGVFIGEAVVIAIGVFVRMSIQVTVSGGMLLGSLAAMA